MISSVTDRHDGSFPTHTLTDKTSGPGQWNCTSVFSVEDVGVALSGEQESVVKALL